MDPVEVHLLLHHVPSVGVVMALAFLGWGLRRRSCDVTIAALFSLVVVALVAVPVYVSGIGMAAGDARLPVPLELVERHRASAMAAMIGIVATAATAVAALVMWRNTRRLPSFPATATLLVGLAAAVLILRTSNLGSRIRHSELAPPAAAAIYRP
jgi:prepilin signal peptidase PulO-like enzyme (type II secretory pathway)